MFDNLFEYPSSFELELEDEDMWEGAFDNESSCCSHCGLPRQDNEFDFEVGGNPNLVDVVVSPPSSFGSYGKASSFKNPATTTDRCKGGIAKTCPSLPGLEDVTQVSGVGFEYIGGWTDKKKKDHPGIIYSKSQGRWIVVEKNRLKNRTQKMLPRAGAGLEAFLANMNAVGMPVEAILSMGSIYCRCITDTTTLSNHSYGDAVDVGGLRFVGGQEVLIANFGIAADRKILHRVNACLRLSFATVIDYHNKHHWNHFHCDTNINNNGKRKWSVAWPYVRESLGLKPNGGFNKELANALRKFAGSQDAVKDQPTLDRTLSSLFMREATRA